MYNEDFFDWIFSGKEWFFAIFGSLVGVLIGIAWTRWEILRDFDARTRPAKEQLIRALERQLKLAEDARNQFSRRSPPNFTLDSAILFRAIDVALPFVSDPILTDVDYIRFQLDHASVKMVLIYHVAATLGVDIAMAHSEVPSLLGHLTYIDGLIHDAISKVRHDTSKPPPPIFPLFQ